MHTSSNKIHHMITASMLAPKRCLHIIIIKLRLKRGSRGINTAVSQGFLPKERSLKTGAIASCLYHYTLESHYCTHHHQTCHDNLYKFEKISVILNTIKKILFPKQHILVFMI